MSSLRSLIASGTKLWLDSIDPELIAKNRALGATGATSNPIIIADLIKTGRFDAALKKLASEGHSDDHIAWQLTDDLVTSAEKVFLPVFEETQGNDGYVSFELDPLIEDPKPNLSITERYRRYIQLGKKWAAGHPNRMIKIPATPAGLGVLEELTEAGITINVTLIFSARQYEIARNAIWRGAQKRSTLAKFKSVYSIFVSRLDVYSEKAVPQLAEAQGMVGIVNAKRIWQMNNDFWKAHPTPLQQEMIFASTGTKKPTDSPWKYVEALAGSDIQTNPPATNDAVEKSGRSFTRQVDVMPSASILSQIDSEVDMHKLEKTLMEEGIAKFADPQHALLKLIAEKRAAT